MWETQVGRLRRFAAKCGDREVKLRAVLLPYIRVDDSMLDRASLHAQVRTALEAVDVEAVDLLPAIVGKEWRELIVNHNDAHPNETAHALFADAIWKVFYARPFPGST